MATILMIWLLCGVAASLIGQHRGSTGPVAGFFWGFILGIFGVIIVTLMRVDGPRDSRDEDRIFQ